MTRVLFEQHMNDVKVKLLKMAAFTQQAFSDSLDALQQNDTEKARQIIQSDKEADRLKRELEQDCFKIIAREQPIAKDLRALTVVLMIVTDLERVCDHAADISKLNLLLEGKDCKSLYGAILPMREVAHKMLVDAINSYAYKDIEQAQYVCRRDDELDSLFSDVIDSFEARLSEEEKDISAITKYMFIAKYLERIGDHSTNIGEWTIFLKTGVYEDGLGDHDAKERKPLTNK